VPSLNPTPTTPVESHRIRLTRLSVESSPPKLRNALSSASGTAPLPPTGRPTVHRRLESVRHRLCSLAHSKRPLTEVHSEAASLIGSVAQVMTEELKTRPSVRAKERWQRRDPAPRR
jgi:hypothetical protein